ncbi:MAG: alpha-galactosidase, partial [Agathobacter sp.]|nr:alpha-galactosidase [Agathobacter sp.]
MAIVYDEIEKVFLLSTENTTYAIAITDETFLCHLYYGRKIQDSRIRYLLKEEESPYVPSVNKRETNSFLDMFPMEYPETGMGDYRESAFCVKNVDGHRASQCGYRHHVIKEGKPEIPGLPSTFATDEECSTLYIYCEDEVLNLQLCLMYSVFEKEDVITRSVKVENYGKEPVYIEKILSACLDMEDRNFEWVSLHGTWARERHIQTLPIAVGRQNVASFKGESSHQEHPFIALATKGATQDVGEIYAMHFVYSGNFLAQVEKNAFHMLRMTMGIHPEGFTWKLEPGGCFSSPEVVMTYSAEGYGRMTRNLHELYRNHLIRSSYLHKNRPILINNWEATYFNFDENKLLEIAKQAAKLGIEMFVLDDGWFGKRNKD